MKKNVHSKFAALILVAASFFVGCGNPAGGSDNGYTDVGGG